MARAQSPHFAKGRRAAAYLCGLGVLNHNLIPWEVVVPKERRDEQLKAKLRTEASGILNWMLHGLADYLKNGMQYPLKVESATSQYRESQDVIAQFIAAKCVLDVNAEVRFSELYSALQILGGRLSGIHHGGAQVLGLSQETRGCSGPGKDGWHVVHGNCSHRIGSAISRHSRGCHLNGRLWPNSPERY